MCNGLGVASTYRRNGVKTLEGPWVWPITKGRMGLIGLGVTKLWRQNGVKGLASQKGPGYGQNGVKGLSRQKGPMGVGRMGLRDLAGRRVLWVWAKWG